MDLSESNAGKKIVYVEMAAGNVISDPFYCLKVYTYCRRFTCVERPRGKKFTAVTVLNHSLVLSNPHTCVHSFWL